MNEENNDLDNLYLQCQSCANKYTSFECALCEDFDMYEDENIDVDESCEENFAYLQLDDVATPEEWELMKSATKDFGQFLAQLGHQVRLDRGDSDV